MSKCFCLFLSAVAWHYAAREPTFSWQAEAARLEVRAGMLADASHPALGSPLAVDSASGGFWSVVGDLFKSFAEGALGNLGSKVFGSVYDTIANKTSDSSNLKSIPGSVNNISSQLGQIEGTLKSVVHAVNAVNDHLTKIDATLDFISQEIAQLIKDLEMAPLETAYEYITQKHMDFAACLQSEACLVQGNGSLFEFCHDDNVCENEVVNTLELNLATIHAYLVGAEDPLSHSTKPPLIEQTALMLKKSKTIEYDQQCNKTAYPHRHNVGCDAAVALPMLSYMMKASITQLQGTSMYVSILDRWGFSSRAAEAGKEFQQRVSQQFALADRAFGKDIQDSFQALANQTLMTMELFPTSQCVPNYYHSGDSPWHTHDRCIVTVLAHILGMEDLCCGNGNLTCEWYDAPLSLDFDGSTVCAWKSP